MSSTHQVPTGQDLACVLDAGAGVSADSVARLRRDRHHGAHRFRAEYCPRHHSRARLLRGCRHRCFLRSPRRWCLPDDFHVYAVEWNPQGITWFVDDVAHNTITPPTSATTVGVRPAVLHDPQRRRGWFVAGSPRPDHRIPPADGHRPRPHLRPELTHRPGGHSPPGPRPRRPCPTTCAGLSGTPSSSAASTGRARAWFSPGSGVARCRTSASVRTSTSTATWGPARVSLLGGPVHLRVGTTVLCR